LFADNEMKDLTDFEAVLLQVLLTNFSSNFFVLDKIFDVNEKEEQRYRRVMLERRTDDDEDDVAMVILLDI